MKLVLEIKSTNRRQLARLEEWLRLTLLTWADDDELKLRGLRCSTEIIGDHPRKSRIKRNYR